MKRVRLTESALRGLINEEMARILAENVNARDVKRAIEAEVDGWMNGYQGAELDVVFGNNINDRFDLFLKDYDEDTEEVTIGVDYMGRTAYRKTGGGLYNKRGICNAAYDAFMEAYLNLG